MHYCSGAGGGARWRQVRLQCLSARRRSGHVAATREAALAVPSTSHHRRREPPSTHCQSTPLHRAASPARYTQHGYAASSQSAIGRRRALDGRARILHDGAAGEGDRRREHGDAQHAGRQYISLVVRLVS